jgi:hypothetical protein
MTRLARFLCPTCGKQLPGDVLDPGRRPGCDDCGKAAQLWEKVDSILLPAPPAVQPSALPPPVPAVPPPLPAPAPVSGPSPALSKKLFVAACLFLLGAGLLALYVVRRNMETARQEAEQAAARAESARREAEQATANQLVAAKVEAARAHMARQDFDEAIKVLDGALAVEHASRLDDARLALLQARQGKADLLLDGAAAAVTRRNPAQARRLLKDYLAHPDASRRARATVLLNELDRATDDEAVAQLLSGLSDEQLTALAEKGLPPAAEPLTDEGMRELYRETLRRHLLKEQEVRLARRREAQAVAERRERERKEREDRLRAEPLFVEAVSFAAGVRKQFQEQTRQRLQEERALELFFRETNLNDETAREKAREALRAGREPSDFLRQVILKKGQVKKDFRRTPNHDPADEELFDRLVDDELDRLLTEIKGGNKP